MPDVPYPPEEEPTKAERVNARVLVALEDALRLIRLAFTGEATGKLRRPVLFILVALALTLNVPALGVVALVGLIWTDNLYA